MEVGIIGAGSIGLLFAACLSCGFKVRIYTRTPEQAAEINKNGILVLKGSEQTRSIVHALPIKEWKGTEEMTIIAVKQYQLHEIIERMNQLPSVPGNLLFLQNGMGHLKLLEGVGADNIFVGSVEHGALKENAYTVSHNGAGMTNVAVYSGSPDRLDQFISFVPEEFPIRLKEDYYEMLLNKLIVNSVINPLTAILQVKNGALIQNQYYLQAIHNLFSEIAYILKLDKQERYLEQIINICKNTADNRSSMLKDLDAARPTEVDAILGFLLEEAVRQNKKAAQVENLYYLIKGKESQRGVLS